MKKFIALILILSLVLIFVGCEYREKHNTIGSDNQINNQTDNVILNNSITEFSYADDYKKVVEGEAGVKTSGFLNTSKTDINFDYVVEVAKNECTIEWDIYKVFLDKNARIWKVSFAKEGVAGGDQCVYIDYDGRTVLIVYGE